MSGIRISEEQLNSIIDATADAIVIVDMEGVVRFANSAAAVLFGRPLDEIIGRPFGFPVVAGETTELDINRPGDQAPVVAEFRVVASAWNGAPAMIVSLRDITERKRAEVHQRELMLEQLARAHAEASERRTRFLLAATNALSESLDFNATLTRLSEICVQYLGDWCVIDLVESDRTIARVAVAQLDPTESKLARELAEISPEQHPLPEQAEVLRSGRSALVTRWRERIAAVSDSALHSTLERVAPHEAMIVPMTVRNRTLGTITILSTRSKRTYTPADIVLAEEVARYAGTAVDNSRLYQEAERGSKAKSNFLAVMSHELRTPLNAIIGYSDLLILGVPVGIPPAACEHVSRVRASARHLLRLIEEILTFTRMEAGKEPIDVTEVRLHAVVQDVAALIEPLAMDRHLEFNVHLPEKDYRIRTDEGRLGQVLLNLLSNAVKFTPAGSVTLDVVPVDDWTHFHVRDSGVGIPAEHLERIFEPFWQADQDRTRRAEGTGLGLSVARRLAKLLGGNLVVQSTLGRGSTFTLQLPNQGP